MLKDQFEVFISYARKGESEKIVNDLEIVLQRLGLTVIRDKTNLKFKGLIRDFMKKIGSGKAVVVVISDKYLKSTYCMFELLEIYRNHDFVERIFPIVLEDANIFDPDGKLRYSKYWKEKTSKLQPKISKSPATSSVIYNEYEISRKVSNNLGDLLNELEDINALTPLMHRESNFQELCDALLKRLDEDFRYTQQKDTQKVLKQLLSASHKYYKELTGINGAYHHLNIFEDILAGISQSNSVDHSPQTLLN